jgi:hypothetical protein
MPTANATTGLTNHLLSGAKGVKEHSRHSPEVAQAVEKRKKAVEKKRAERQKKTMDGKVKL